MVPNVDMHYSCVLSYVSTTYLLSLLCVISGMLEMVTESATLRAIQTEHGLTGSFKDKPLSEWLQRHNTTESAYKQVL